MNKEDNSYKTISEVVKILNLKSKKGDSLPTHTLRFWEKEFDEIKNGGFHDNLFVKLKENNFLNFETGKKLPKETIDLLNLQKNTVMKQFKENSETYFAKSSFPLSSSQNAFGLVWRMCETYELSLIHISEPTRPY